MPEDFTFYSATIIPAGYPSYNFKVELRIVFQMIIQHKWAQLYWMSLHNFTLVTTEHCG
jgi:hypothetical protein